MLGRSTLTLVASSVVLASCGAAPQPATKSAGEKTSNSYSLLAKRGCGCEVEGQGTIVDTYTNTAVPFEFKATQTGTDPNNPSLGTARGTIIIKDPTLGRLRYRVDGLGCFPNDGQATMVARDAGGQIRWAASIITGTGPTSGGMAFSDYESGYTINGPLGSGFISLTALAPCN